MARAPFEGISGAEQADLGTLEGGSHVHDCGVAANCEAAFCDQGGEQGEVQPAGENDQREAQWAVAEHGQSGLYRSKVVLLFGVCPSSEDAGEAMPALDVEDDLGPALRKPVFFKRSSAWMQEYKALGHAAFLEQKRNPALGEGRDGEGKRRFSRGWAQTHGFEQFEHLVNGVLRAKGDLDEVLVNQVSEGALSSPLKRHAPARTRG